MTYFTLLQSLPIQTMEVIVLIIISLGLVISAIALHQACRIRDNLRRDGRNGALKILAASGIRNEGLRVLAQLVLFTVSLVGTIGNPPLSENVDFYVVAAGGRVVVSLILVAKTGMNLYDRRRVREYLDKE